MKQKKWEEKERRKEEERRFEKKKNQKKVGAGARKGRKVATHGVLHCFVAVGVEK